MERVERAKNEFYGAMNDDFNTAEALAAVYSLVGEVNRWLAGRSEVSRRVVSGVLGAFDEFGDVLNLFQAREHRADALVDGLVDLVLAVRAEARRQHDFETADMIRGRLEDMGIDVQDTPEGPRWSYARI